jgi:cytochrome c-type biogenesis protein CcmH/NrfG
MSAAAMAAMVGTAALFVAVVALPWQPAPPPSKAVAERIKRDSASCKSNQNLETCDDAVRWDPSDPALLVAFGDALLRAQHPAEALRQYQRAAALAPKMPGVTAKISAAEARLPSKRGPARPLSVARSAADPVAPASPVAAKPPVARNANFTGQPYTNDAVESHSH